MELNESVLDFWITQNYNVLMKGRRGTGKTTMIKGAFDRAYGTRWRYFSAPTMDPWVDLVGVPKEKKSEKTGNSYLELIRPQEFADDEVEAIFFDELNRAKPKIIDAVMELIQFKSINGRKFNNLKVIWGAINPENHNGDDEEEYNVERLDPAHVDRFHIHVDAEYKLNEEFFHTKFPTLADAGVSWWNRLKEKEKNKVSPRRLEYALDCYTRGGDIAYVLPKEVNPSSLAIQLKNGSFAKKMQELYVSKDGVAIKKALMNENFYNAVKDDILAKNEYMKVFAPHFPNEKFNNLIITDAKFKNFILNDAQCLESSQENLRYIIEANSANQKLIKEIKEKLSANKLYAQAPISIIVENHYNDLGPSFLENVEAKMRICSFIQLQDITNFKKEDLVKAAVVLALTVEHTNLAAWLSTKMAFKKLRDECPKHGWSFAGLVDLLKNDPQYNKFKGNEKKLAKLFEDEGLLNESSITSAL
jgi:hypothetical protein